ncbi:26S proteasome non-ATPase regulatory subunit 3 [Phytophthora cinnamomi]|uniref:26S proteasome non-ATPase regulatory subunit 3 n=1 Tax=Phytophthora cinnamomi TaxID=4785 RepID=UPI003559C7E0|nr:26S proteasome non-ATPase regulatory subunit 3 [Phytophthora cinnamomi]
MSAQSTFSQTPAYKVRLAGPKEVAAEEALVYEELKRTITLLETVVKTNAKEKIPRILRTTSKLRKTLSVAQLQLAVEQLLPAQNASKPALLALLAKIDAKAQVAAAEARAAATKDQDVEMTDASPEVETPAASGAPAAVVLPVVDLIEVEIYLFLYVLAALMKYKLAQEALDTVDKVVARCQQFNRRTLDLFQAKVFTYYSTIHEQFGHDLPAIRNTLLGAHRTSCLRYDEAGQATLINLLLRNYLKDNLYEQAYKFVSKTTFPETVSNNQFVRYLYYVGKIQAVQLEYTESYTKLMQSIRKAPANTAFGFRRTVYKLAIIVQLLMGEVPERNVFNQDELRKALAPYLQLTNAVRVGNLEDFNVVLSQHGAVFKADNTYTLILRLRHNVIKTGLRKISTSYSRILFTDICEKLALENAQNAEFVCAKAIRDGVIDAVIDHENGWLQLKETVNVYTTNDPQTAFQRRITFCLDVHNEAVKAMRYPPDAYKKDLESAEERLEREKQEEELAKEIEDEMDEGL